ncbi:DUF5959 family protein [Streptomyces sp. NPDC059979]|uniref:DUF5959 family protein n=1 Tax=Streptomyces sp. NPDC059979 TaxID=3347021 RepID=UPI00368D937F
MALDRRSNPAIHRLPQTAHPTTPAASAWQHDLTQLAPGKGATIGGDRGLSLDFFMHEDRTLSLMVQDPDRMSLAMGIAPQETWVQDHHQRLDQVRETWPDEIVETGPMTYEWNPNRRGQAMAHAPTPANPTELVVQHPASNRRV